MTKIKTLTERTVEVSSFEDMITVVVVNEEGVRSAAVLDHDKALQLAAVLTRTVREGQA